MNRPRAAFGSMAVTLFFLGLPGCGPEAGTSGTAEQPLTVGVAFETLQTEYWVASLDALRAELKQRGYGIQEAIADGDAARQLEQVNGLIARGVDGLIVVPKDAQSVIPMIRAANRAEVPIVLYNRPPAPNSGKCVTVVADNRALAKATVAHLIGATTEPIKALVLIGDLGDTNAIERREGFDEAITAAGGRAEVVSRVPTEWNQEKALAGTVNALQAHPEINLIFASSDFLFPSVVSALKGAGKYAKAGEPGHVLLGGFDGDATAHRLLKEGYVDADGVQDVAFECKQAVDALLKLRAGETVPALLLDPGLVIHRDNLEAESDRMWGAKVAP